MSFLARGTRPLWLVLAAALALYAALAADSYAIRLLTVAGIWALLGIGYQLVFGHVGALSLAQGAFYGIGAYAAAIAGKTLGLPLPLGLLLAMLLPALLAAAVTLPVLQLQTHYFALATLGIAQTVHLLAVNWESLTGGANGFGGLPPLSLFGFGLQPGGLAWLALVWGLVGLAGWLVAALLDGMAGRALTLMREHPLAAHSLGLDTGRWRLAALIAAAGLAGLAGGLAAHTAGVVSPDVADLPMMVACLTLVVVGGRRHVAGAVLGAILVVHLPEWFRFLDRYWLVAYGVATLLIVIAAPAGIVGSLEALWKRRRPPPLLLPDTAKPESRPVAAGGETVLAAVELQRRFGGVQALAGVSLTLRRGEIVGLIGPNGSGKTTLVNLLSGIDRADAGSLTIAGTPADGLPAWRIAALGVARSFQNLELPAEMTVLDNVALAAGRHRLSAAPLSSLLAALRRPGDDPLLAASRTAALAVLERCGLAGLAGRRAGDLPAGQRRLVEIARALAGQPAVLLLDEPAAGLAESERVALQGLLRQAANDGIAVLVVEHALGFLLPIAQRIVCLDRGGIAAEGAPQALLGDPRLAQAYFGLAPAAQGRPT